MRVLTAIYHLPARLAIGFVKVYQAVVSPHMAPSCRFSPTCSEYAVQAFRTYGLMKGLVLSTHRILRCHPWGGQGYDPPRWYGEAEVAPELPGAADGE